MATASGQTIINLRWAVPADNGGAAITGYRVEVSEDAGSTWMDLVANTTATTYSHTGLPPETTRHYRVRAINAVGTGAASNVASATTEAATVLSFASAISSQPLPGGPRHRSTGASDRHRRNSALYLCALSRNASGGTLVGGRHAWGHAHRGDGVTGIYLDGDRCPGGHDDDGIYAGESTKSRLSLRS